MAKPKGPSPKALLLLEEFRTEKQRFRRMGNWLISAKGQALDDAEYARRLDVYYALQQELIRMDRELVAAGLEKELE